jgi:hypothetical protein
VFFQIVHSISFPNRFAPSNEPASRFQLLVPGWKELALRHLGISPDLCAHIHHLGLERGGRWVEQGDLGAASDMGPQFDKAAPL